MIIVTKYNDWTWNSPEKERHIYHNNKSLIVTNFFSTNKQYVKIKLMQNETNRWSIFFGKDEKLLKLWF